MGHYAAYYTSPQSFIITVSYSLAQQHWGLFLWIFIGWIIKLIVQTLQPLIFYIRGSLCIIIRYVHQSIGHCHIPLDPWRT